MHFKCICDVPQPSNVYLRANILCWSSTMTIVVVAGFLFTCVFFGFLFFLFFFQPATPVALPETIKKKGKRERTRISIDLGHPARWCSSKRKAFITAEWNMLTLRCWETASVLPRTARPYCNQCLMNGKGTMNL